MPEIPANPSPVGVLLDVMIEILLVLVCFVVCFVRSTSYLLGSRAQVFCPDALAYACNQTP